MKNFLDVVKVLIEQPTININAQDEEENTLLHCACGNNALDVANFLLEQPKISLNAQKKLGYTAFTYACDSNEEVINVMLSTKNYKIEQLKGFINHFRNQDGSQEFKQVSMRSQDKYIKINSV